MFEMNVLWSRFSDGINWGSVMHVPLTFEGYV